MKDSELVKLVQDTFGQEPGASLLKELIKIAQSRSFESDPYKMYYNAGMDNQAHGWDDWVKAGPRALENIIEQEIQNSSFNEDYEL